MPCSVTNCRVTFTSTRTLQNRPRAGFSPESFAKGPGNSKMCGICGIMNLGPPDNGGCNGLIDRMTETLAHRGPNDRGTWCGDRIALGHRRLSVIDLSEAGRQPMGNEDGSIQIVYNGEVYNFRELKKKHALAERGHIFRSRTDTEVLIHLYETIGLEKMLAEL